MCPAACLVVAGYEVIGMLVGAGMLGSIGKGIAGKKGLQLQVKSIEARDAVPRNHAIFATVTLGPRHPR